MVGQHRAPTKMSWSKRIVTILLVLFLIACFIQVVSGIRQAADASVRCPGGHDSFHRTRYLGDSRHAPWRLAELNVKARACYNKKGWLKSGTMSMYVHSNGTAATLGYRYELRPGNDGRKKYRTDRGNHTWAMMLHRHASYRQCIPGVPGGIITCGPDGLFHAEVTMFAKRAVKRDPFINHRFTFLIFKDSGYSREFMEIYKNP